jgi:cholesterol transport system auxiliary component
MKRTVLVIPILLLAGCGGGLLAPSGPAPALYTLAAPERIETNAPQASWQLLVDAPNAPLDLDSARIAIAPSTSRIDYYADVVWADRVPAMLQQLLVESFDRSGRIAAVQRQNGGLHGDFTLAPDIGDFEVDASSNPQAHIRITARLVRMRDRTIVASRSFDAAAPVGGSGIDPVVAAFDSVLSELLPQIVDWTLSEGARNK